MASFESVDMQLELPPGAVATPLEGKAFPAANVARRALHDGRLRSILIFLGSLIVASAFQSSPKSVASSCILFTLSWTISIHVLEHSLRTIRVVAGRAGVAALASVTGLAVAGSASFWLQPQLADRAEVISMALVVLGTILALEVAKSRLAVLRSRVLLIGSRTTTSELIALLAVNRQTPFSAVGVVTDDGDRAETNAGVPILVRSLRCRTSCETPYPTSSSSRSTAAAQRCSRASVTSPSSASESSVCPSFTSMRSVAFRSGR